VLGTLGEFILRIPDKVGLLGNPAFQAREMASDLLGREQASDLGDEPRQTGGKLRVSGCRLGKFKSFSPTR